MKLEQQEIDKLKEISSFIDNTIIQLGEITYKKLDLQLQEEVIKQNISKINESKEKLNLELFNKYGKIDINLETGEYTPKA